MAGNKNDTQENGNTRQEKKPNFIEKLTQDSAKRKAEAEKKKAEAEKKRRADAEKRKAEAEKKRKEEAEKKKAEAEKKKQAEAEKKKAEAEKKKKAEAEKRLKEQQAKKSTQAKKPAGKNEQTAKPAGKGIRFLDGLLFSKMAKSGANELSNNADEVNKLNVFPVPDGDTGDNMKMTIESGVAAIEGLDNANLAEVMHVLSHGMLLGARGNSGVILSQFFAGMAKGIEGVEQANPKALGKALEMGVEQAYASVMTPTEGTILTVARESVEFAVSKLRPQSTIKTFFQDLVNEMHASLNRTPEMLAALKEAEVVDSGGAGLLYIMDGFNQVLNGKHVKRDESASPMQKPVLPTASGFGPDSVMTYGYCTELLLQLQRSKTDIDNYDIEPLKEYLAGIGDSVVAFKTDSIVKVHVHTLTPEKVLEYCRKVGEFLTVKIENMSVQHTENSEIKNAEQTEKKAEEEKPAEKQSGLQADKTKERQKYAVVSVCNGAGLVNLFRDLGTTEIIIGGQSRNPSTNDFIDAFDKIDAENIFVFPNNGNIQMAAAQAAEMYKKAKIYVVPSKIVSTGYVALSALDFDNPDPDAVYEGMLAAMSAVTSGYVSPSIRDAEIGGIQIKNGDTIGIIGKDIVVSEQERADAVKFVADKLLESGDKFMLTLFVGKDSEPDECDRILDSLREKYPDIEIYSIDGGQEIYPYIFVAE